ncbi:hypothetical protein GCM10020001_076950 [Nonomuraea salmonea]
MPEVSAPLMSQPGGVGEIGHQSGERLAQGRDLQAQPVLGVRADVRGEGVAAEHRHRIVGHRSDQRHPLPCRLSGLARLHRRLCGLARVRRRPSGLSRSQGQDGVIVAQQHDRLARQS